MRNTSKLKDLISQGENSFIEFKNNFGKEAIISIVALANTDGGYLLVGISDKKEIKGVSVNHETIQNYINQIKNATYPHVIPEIFEEKLHDKSILVFKISESPVKPIAYKNRYYKRHNNSNHIMTLEEIVNLQQQTLNLSYDSHIINDRISILDESLIDITMKQIARANRFAVTDNNFLNLIKMNLIRNGKITIASKILFAENNYSIHIGRFRSEETIIDDLLINKPLVKAIDEAMIFIKKHINIEFRIGNSLQREEIWQYPLVVIRELLLNSLVHRDYQSASDVIIKIFDNKIIFSNPGRLYKGLTIEDIKGNYYSSSLRNKLIADTFFLLGDIEKYGTGFVRIRKILENYEYKITIDFKETGENFIVILNNGGINKDDGGINEDNGGINEDEKILDLIYKNPGIRTDSISKSLLISKRTVERYIKKLKDTDKIEFIGSKKTGGYFVKQKIK